MSRLSVASWGEWKKGKTRFLLSFPAPIIVFDLNFGFEGVDRQVFEEEDIKRYSIQDDDIGGLKLDHKLTVVGVNEPVFAEADGRVQVYNRFKPWYTKALKLASKEGGTLGVDTATELDDLVQAATLEEVRVHKYKGKTDAEDFQPSAFDYGKRNDIMARIYTAPLQVPNLNACFTHKAKPEYQGKEQTGRHVMAGWSGAGGQVQVVMHQYKEGNQFKGRVEVCRGNPAFEGTVVDNPSYAELVDLLL